MVRQSLMTKDDSLIVEKDLARCSEKENVLIGRNGAFLYLGREGKDGDRLASEQRHIRLCPVPKHTGRSKG
jgi:hypothetical protein